MPDVEVHRMSNEPWGRTIVKATFGYGDLVALDISGAAEVTSTQQSFRAIEVGASCQKIHYMFGKAFVPATPGPAERNVLGVMLLYRDPRRLAKFRPEPGATFIVTIGPSALVIENDDGTMTREALRAPINSVLAMALETLLPQIPPVAPSVALPVPTAVRKLMASA